jgi:hypothetical protein
MNITTETVELTLQLSMQTASIGIYVQGNMVIFLGIMVV